MRQSDVDSNLGAGVDGQIIKDTIESANTVEELITILNDITPNPNNINPDSLYSKIIEQASDVYGATLSYEVKGGKPGVTRNINKLYNNPRGQRGGYLDPSRNHKR